MDIFHFSSTVDGSNISMEETGYITEIEMSESRTNEVGWQKHTGSQQVFEGEGLQQIAYLIAVTDNKYDVIKKEDFFL